MNNIRRGHRRGVSTLVSALLMITVAVACSTMTYFWVTSFIKFQASRSQTEIRVEQVTWIDHKNFKITIRNLGVESTTIESVTIRKSTPSSDSELININASISPGSLTELHCTLLSLIINDNTSYTARATTNTGFFYDYTSVV